LVQKRFAQSISGHQETIAHFQDLTVCLYAFVLENAQLPLAGTIYTVLKSNFMQRWGKDSIVVRDGLFFILCVMGLGLCFTPLRELFGLSLRNELYSHIILIPFVSLYFIILKRSVIFCDLAYSYRVGVPLISAGALSCFFGKYCLTTLSQNDHLSLMIFGAVIWFVGCFILCFGISAFRKGAFPVLFLVFMIPVPSVLLDPLIRLLQTGSLVAAHGILKVTGVPFFREGFVISLSGIDVEVAKECSGIRSFIALFITSVVAGRLFLRTGWRRIVLILSVFLIAMFKNGLRVVTLSLLAAYVNETFITNSWLHRSGGIPFFGVALIFLALVLWLLKKSEKKNISKPGQLGVEVGAGSRAGGRNGLNRKTAG
jgi:exosortase